MNSVAADGRQPLHVACQKNSLEADGREGRNGKALPQVISWLLACRADVDAKGHNGVTAAFVAAQQGWSTGVAKGLPPLPGFLPALRLLCEARCSPDVRDHSGTRKHACEFLLDFEVNRLLERKPFRTGCWTWLSRRAT